ncbi:MULTISPECIES: DUF4302 domain-containing protein [Sphingobacterium]|uniref:DUF4302 domain-containing protein n=1 Tax=Sphingobacterium TaxID=28453 RepID=UPI00191AF6FA|nr:MULTISPECIES: DUF4302 domain-containing protein [Sphingobacterium]QQT27124.1 DUF4302 domain-containing protein [Sphingobacterium spiritivorum]
MKSTILTIGAALLLLVTGCDKKRDRLFDESPTVRLNESVDNAYAVLQSNPSGWLIKYFPNATQDFGGYTLFAKFTTSVNVELQGDFSYVNLPTSRISTDPNSSYMVYPGAGPILTFDTYNSAIHYFSLPGQFMTNATLIGLVDGGYKGDFEFLVVKATADSVILEGRKTYNKIVMLPIGNSEAATIVQAHKDAVTKFHAYGAYSFEVAGKTLAATFPNTTTKRALRISGNTTNFAYRYTPTGLEFYKDYTIEGVRFKQLTYVAPTGSYTRGYFENAEKTLKLVPGS